MEKTPQLGEWQRHLAPPRLIPPKLEPKCSNVTNKSAKATHPVAPASEKYIIYCPPLRNFKINRDEYVCCIQGQVIKNIFKINIPCFSNNWSYNEYLSKGLFYFLRQLFLWSGNSGFRR